MVHLLLLQVILSRIGRLAGSYYKATDSTTLRVEAYVTPPTHLLPLQFVCLTPSLAQQQADRPISFVDLNGCTVEPAIGAGRPNCFELVGSDGKVFFVACRVCEIQALVCVSVAISASLTYSRSCHIAILRAARVWRTGGQ
jgi:hypothetical protein